MSEKFELSRDWNSYIPVLAQVISTTDGKIVEYGTGLVSTPLLHWLCYPKKRELVSFESDPYFFEIAKQYSYFWHEVIKVDSYDTLDLPECEVAFVDSFPHDRRGEIVERLKDKAKIIVVHDTFKDFEYFKYRFDFYNEHSNSTSVLSNFVDVSKLKI